MTNKDTVASIIKLTFTQIPNGCPIHDIEDKNLPQLSLQYHPIPLETHTDPSIGTHTCIAAYHILSAAGVVAGIVS